MSDSHIMNSLRMIERKVANKRHIASQDLVTNTNIKILLMRIEDFFPVYQFLTDELERRREEVRSQQSKTNRARSPNSQQ